MSTDELEDSGRSRGARADAVRNRARIVASAHAVFTSQGSGASVRVVASRAGVGLGTLYRHFPDKEALLQAVVEDRFRFLTERTVQARETLAPWPAFVAVMRLMAQMMTEDRALAGAIGGGRPAGPETGESPARRELDATLLELADRAKAAGELRAEIQPSDLGLIIGTVAMSLSGHLGQVLDATAWQRYLDVVLDGLRESSRGAAER